MLWPRYDVRGQSMSRKVLLGLLVLPGGELQRRNTATDRVRGPRGARRALQRDAEGACEIPAPDQPWLLARIEHPGFCHAHAWLGADPIEVVLRRAARLAGNVRDAVTRTPVAGATIHWEIPRQRICPECWPEPVVSDALGNYAIDELLQVSEPVLFQVEAGGYPWLRESFGIAGDEPFLAHDFVLAPGLELAGEVVDHATGLPLEGASLFAWGGSTRSDALGRFRLLVAGGTGNAANLLAGLEGYCGLEIPVVVGTGEPLRIRMVKGVTLTGSVRDSVGRAVAGVKVFAAAKPAEERAGLPPLLGLPPQWRWYSSTDRVEGESAADGRFTLAGLLPHQEKLWVSTIHEGFRPARLELATGAPGEVSACVFVLEPEASLGTIRGRLTLNGKPASAAVRWQGPTREGYAWTQGEEYLLEHVEPGRIALRVRIGGSDSLRDALVGHEATLEVTGGAELVHDFELVLAIATIAGAVRFADGTPIAGQTVEYRGAGRQAGKTLAGADGAYAFEVPVQAGPFQLWTVFAGESIVKSGIAAGASDVDFVLPPMGELRYRALEAGTERPLPGCWTHWRRAGEKDFHALAAPGSSPDAGGWFRATIPLGPVELLASSDQHRWSFAPGVVIGPGPNEHVFELEPGFALTFELDPSSGPWPADHALVVVEAEAAPSLGCEVGPGERYRWTYGDRFAPGTLQRRRLDFAARPSVTLDGLRGRQLLLVFPADLVLEPAEVRVDGPRSEAVPVRWRRK